MIRSALFVTGSALLALASLRSLRRPESHGFVRYFGWVAILGLVLLAAPRWFADPFSPRQIASWLLLFASIPLVVEGARLLHRVGRPSDERRDPALYRIERTSALVTTGLYHYIRHPIYGSLICLALGAALKDVTWATTSLAAAAVVFLVLTALKDEQECVRYFGPAYEDTCAGRSGSSPSWCRRAQRGASSASSRWYRASGTRDASEGSCIAHQV